MSITELLINYFTAIISTGGYWGVMLLMALESMIAPVPSEAVMPFVGFLLFQKRFFWLSAIFFSTFGSLIGSLVSYCLGAWGGRPLIAKYGKYFLLNEYHLQKTEKFFTKHGDKTIFISRFIPIVRHLISIPAGLGRMNLGKFLLYTALGAGLWNSFLAYLGYYLGSRWHEIKKYSEVADVVLIVLIIAAVIAGLIHRRRERGAGVDKTSIKE